MPLRLSWHVVHGKDGLAGELLEQAVFHHLLGAAQAFFGGLKNQVHRARKHPLLSDVLGRSQQHGGVTIVATGVHDAHLAAGIGQAGGFFNGQGVHVGTDADAFGARAFFELADHTGAAQAPSHLVAPGAQLLGHQVTGAVLLVAHLRVPVDVAAHRDELIRLGVMGLQFVVHQSFSGGVHGVGLVHHWACRLIDLAMPR